MKQAQEFRLVVCACHQDNHNPDCWYQLWYFWFILIGILLSIIVLVVFYCKYQAKNRSRVGFLGRRPRISMSIAVGPPPYDAPSNNPPPYHIAMQNAQAISFYRPSCSPPGFIEECPDFFYPGSMYPYEPPPYSPPPSHPPARLQTHHPPHRVPLT